LNEKLPENRSLPQLTPPCCFVADQRFRAYQRRIGKAIRLNGFEIYLGQNRCMSDGIERRLALREAGEARTDFAAIESDLEMIMARLARMPTRQDLWRAALLRMTGGACLVQSLTLLFCWLR
jgi:hypothetical protein